MTSIRTVHTINSSICFPLSMTLNLTMIWLIWHKTPKDMRRYSVILLQTVALDMTLSIVLELTQPIYYSIGADEFYFLSGPLGNIESALFQFIMINIYIICYNFVTSGQMAQFIYRYLLINWEYQLSLPQYFLVLCAPFSLNLATFVLLFYYIPPSLIYDDYNEFAQQLTGLANNTIMIVNFRGTICPIPQMLVVWLFYGSNAILYAVVIFCNVCIIWHLYTHANSLGADEMKKRAHKMNVQLTRSLLVMAMIPVLMQGLSMSEAVTRMGVGAHTYQMWILVPSHWVPVLNPAVNMLTAKYYRVELFKAIRKQISVTLYAVVKRLNKVASNMAPVQPTVAANTASVRQAWSNNRT